MINPAYDFKLQYSLFSGKNTGILIFHGIMECRNKVVKCHPTSHELLTNMIEKSTILKNSKETVDKII